MWESVLSTLREAWAWPSADHVIRLVASVMLGGLVGLEREIRDKPAGFRTIILICVGACLFTILSQAIGGPDWNSTRIAAQVVTGIGFLGAGAILRGSAGIVGMTTAATIWAVAAIGMAVGFGALALATLGTGVILIALLLFEVVEEWIGRWRDVQEYHVATRNTDATFTRIRAVFSDARLQVRKQTCYEEGESLVFHIVAMGAKDSHERTRLMLARSDEYTLRRV